MAKDDSLPFEKLDALKREIEALKIAKSGSSAAKKKTASPENVMDSMEKLGETLQNFMQTFEEATEEMKLEEREEELFIKELKPIHDKLDQVLEQNEKIAKGIIAVANMLNSDIPYIKRMVSNITMKPAGGFENKQAFNSMPPPMQFSAPRPMEQKPLTGAPMPPPPRMPEKKKKSFSELFK